MKSKYGFFAILLMLMLAFSFSNYLYAQAADIESPPVESGDAPILPSDAELESLIRETPNPRAVVNPLVRQKWNQYAPYNNLFPLIRGHAKDDGTGRLYTNCTNTAWAQIMAFHRHPARGSGQSTTVGPNHYVTVSSVNLNVAYDWNNMLNSYRRDGRNSNDRQRNAVAVLMYHVALAVGAQGNYFAAMTENFGYDRSIQKHERIFYTDSGWEALIRSQLDAGLPLYYSSHRQDGGHAFVVDGYDNQGRFHVNWGWGGAYDGWYSLNALVPRPDRNYDRSQYVVINVRPNRGSTGSNEFALTEFTAFQSTGRRSTATINLKSLGFFPGGQAGMAVVDNNNNIISIIASRNIGDNLVGNRLRVGADVSMQMTCVVPETVRPGQYRLMAVTRIEGGQWKIVTLSRVSRIPNAFTLTVTESGAAISRMAVQQTLTLNVPVTVAIDRGLSVQLNFTAPRAGEYTFESSNNGSLRAVAFANVSGATPINNEQGSGTNFRFTRNLRAGEVFTFFAGILTGNASGNYTVNVRAVQLGSLSFTTDTPATVGINNGQRVQLNFTAPAAGDYRFESSNNGSLDPTAYSASTGTGSAVVISQDDGNGKNFLFMRTLRAGEVFTFFAGIRSGTGNGSYTVNVQRVQAVLLTLNTPSTVTINNGQRVQINFTAPSAGVYTFESSNNGSLDPLAYTAVGGSREIDDDSGQGENFLFIRNLRAGETFTFFAGVIRDRGSGSYTVNVQVSR